MALDPNQVTAVKNMLWDLGRRGMKFYVENDYGPWGKVAFHHKAISKEPALDALLPSGKNRAGKLDGQTIPLVPSKEARDAAALLRVEWDFDAEPWILKYYLILYYGQAKDKLPQLGLGFRLEQPEGRGRTSAHDYWHLQMCKSVGSDRSAEVLACHAMVPTSYPAFPLNADSAASLTASLSLAVSGRSGLTAVLEGLRGQGAIVKQLLAKYPNVIA